MTQFFTAALVTKPKGTNNPNLPAQMNYTQRVVYSYTGLLAAIKRNEVITHTTGG